MWNTKYQYIYSARECVSRSPRLNKRGVAAAMSLENSWVSTGFHIEVVVKYEQNIVKEIETGDDRIVE